MLLVFNVTCFTSVLSSVTSASEFQTIVTCKSGFAQDMLCSLLFMSQWLMLSESVLSVRLCIYGFVRYGLPVIIVSSVASVCIKGICWWVPFGGWIYSSVLLPVRY